MNDKEILKHQITDEIDSFTSISPSADIQLSESGQFYIKVRSHELEGIVNHLWQEETGGFDNPGVINVLLVNNKTREKYAISMTECLLEDFPALLRNAKDIIERFLDKNFQLERTSFLGLFKREYLKFEGSELIYAYATKVK